MWLAAEYKTGVSSYLGLVKYITWTPDLELGVNITSGMQENPTDWSRIEQNARPRFPC